MVDKNSSKDAVTRRDFLKSGIKVASTVGVATGSNLLAAKVNSDSNMNLEKTDLSLGFIPLTDCASLVLAKELGIFKKHGLNVQLQKQVSWSNVRDHVIMGALDGAQMLATMPITSTLGIGTSQKPMLTGFTMALNGNGITVSHELYARMLEADPEAMQADSLTARALKKVIDEDKKAGREPMTFATVFPVSTHNYELRYWMASAGINPDKDIRLIVIPPAYMVENLEAQKIVGYCVGEPWNELAVNAGIGRTLTTKYQIWNNSPEKVFAVTNSWADKHPNTHKAILMALMEASIWIDKEENRIDVARILAREEYVNAPFNVVKMSMTGTFQYARHQSPKPMPDFNVFNRYGANYPWRSHAEWFISQMYRWGDLQEPIDIRETASKVYRSDIFASAAKEMGISYPSITHKQEGLHKESWILNDNGMQIQMGADSFFDNKKYDSENLLDYIYSFDIHSNNVDRFSLERLNV